MAVKRSATQVSYGINSPLYNQPRQIIAQRAPASSDHADSGTLWVDEAGDAAYIATSSGASGTNWAVAPSGATTAASMTINPGNLTVTAGNVIVTAGDITASAGTATFGTTIASTLALSSTLNVTGLTTLANVDVVGDMTVTGDFDITDTASISLTSTNDAAGAISLTANGGTSETIAITSSQGTGAASIGLVSTAGGITLNGGLGTADAIAISTTSAGGGVLIETGAAGDEGLIQLRPAVGTAAAATQVLDAYVGVATYTGLTTAMGASATLTLTNSMILATTGVLVTVSNLNASTNGAFLTIDGITQAAGSIVVSYTNNGAGALGAGDDVLLSFMVLNP